MCKLNCNSKINKSFFNNVDLSENIDNIIGKFFGDNRRNYSSSFSNIKIVECGMENCNHKDLDNIFNFKVLCCGCEMKICFDCFNNDNKEDLEDLVCNSGEVNSEWLCYECSSMCENCEEYVYVDSITGLRNKYGDYKYCCNHCINTKELDFRYETESYERNECLVKEIDIKGGENCIECKCEVDLEDDIHYFINEKDIVCEGCVELNVRYM